MSTNFVEVCTIDEITPHSNPEVERLELAKVKGWQLCVPKGMHQVGEKVVYFPEGTVLFPFVADKFGVANYLKRKVDINGNTVLIVNKIRLKGEPSFGLIVSLGVDSWEIGEDVASYYGATKYEPPVNLTRVGNARPWHPKLSKYTEIENIRNIRFDLPTPVFDEGEEVYVSEKIHGTNSMVAMVDGERAAASRRLQRAEPTDTESSLYWYPWSLPAVEALLTELGKDNEQVALYGEIFGNNIQSLNYGSAHTMDYRAFDLQINGIYQDVDAFLTLTKKYGVKIAPEIYRGPFSLDKIKNLSEGQTLLMDKEAHIREGIVVKPIIERQHPKYGRVTFKYISDDYLLGKHAEKDTTDV